MQTTQTNKQDVNYINALIHGASGAGKTTSLGTLPEETTLIAICERGALPLRSKCFDVWKLESWEDVRTMVRLFHIQEESVKKYKTLAIDSLTEISEMCKRQILIDRKAVVFERTKGNRETPEKMFDDQMTQEDYGVYGNRMRGFLSALCHLPVNVVVTSLSHWAKDNTSGESWLAPNLSGKIALECPAYFDLVGYMEAVNNGGEQVHRFRFNEDQNVMAKDATGVNLPNYMEPDWSQVFRTIFQGSNAQ